MRLAAADHRLSDWESLLDELTPRQVTVLQAFQQIEQFGEARADVRAAVTTAAICSSVRMSGQAVDPKDIYKMIAPDASRLKSSTHTPEQVANMIGRAKQKGAG